MSTLVIDYYYTYFQYPEKVDDLINFAWNGIINDVAGHAYTTKMDREQYVIDLIQSDSLAASKIPLLDEYLYLQANRNFINVTVKDNNFIFKCSRDSLAFLYDDIDICRDKNVFGSRIFARSPIFYIYETYLSRKGNLPASQYRKYIDRFYEDVNRFKRNYKGKVDSICFNGETAVRYALLRFERNKGLSSVCPDSLDFQTPFLLQLDSCLNEFVKDKDEIEKIVFVTTMVK